jgi:mersacidin/lichenicidin family type 2 lantibiotic
MSSEQIIKAWKDAEHRESLSDGERAQLPASPVGPVELADGELDQVAGAMRPIKSMSMTTDCYKPC